MECPHINAVTCNCPSKASSVVPSHSETLVSQLPGGSVVRNTHYNSSALFPYSSVHNRSVIFRFQTNAKSALLLLSSPMWYVLCHHDLTSAAVILCGFRCTVPADTGYCDMKVNEPVVVSAASVS